MSSVNRRKYRINSGVSYVHDDVYTNWRNSRTGKAKEGLEFPNPPLFSMRRKPRVSSTSADINSINDILEMFDIEMEED